jgi:hypothetical protein
VLGRKAMADIVMAFLFIADGKDLRKILLRVGINNNSRIR